MFSWLLYKMAFAKPKENEYSKVEIPHMTERRLHPDFSTLITSLRERVIPSGFMALNSAFWADPDHHKTKDENPIHEPPTLQQACRKTIIKAITLPNIAAINALPVPVRIRDYLNTFRIPDDFDTSGSHWSYNYHFPYHPHHRTHRVHPAVCTLDGTKVLLKTQNEDAKNCGLCTMLGAPLLHVQESDHWASISHPYLQTCYMKLEDPSLGVICYVLEYPKISLKDLISQLSGSQVYIPECLILDTVRKLISVISYLHSKGVHVEMYEPQHFILDEEGEVKVENLLLYLPKHGVSTYKTGSFLQQNALYTSPEQLHGMPTGNKSVVWALGCLLYEMTTLSPAFTPEPSYHHLFCPRQHKPSFGLFLSGQDVRYLTKALQLPEQYSMDLHNLITLCLKDDLADRPTLEDMKDHVQQMYENLAPTYNGDTSLLPLYLGTEVD